MYTLTDEQRTTVIAALSDGCSIRTVERLTGFHRDTIMRLSVSVGEECRRILDTKMRNLTLTDIQMDEIWSFVGKKERNVGKRDPHTKVGDQWVFVAIDSPSKLIPCFKVGKRDGPTANAFVKDLSSRLKNRIQLTSDGLRAYIEAVEQGFGPEVDYAQLVKSYSIPLEDQGAGMSERKYSPPEVVRTTKTAIVGEPDPDKISTSYVERQNLQIRMNMRRCTRLTNGFSKKVENFKASVALHFAVYNFVRIHGTIRTTPAVAAGVEKRPWTIRELVELTT